MTRKKTSGLVYDKYGTPWNYIEDVDKTQTEKYESLLDNLIELSGRVSDILTLMTSQGNKLSALEEKMAALTKATKKPARKPAAKKDV